MDIGINKISNKIKNTANTTNDDTDENILIHKNNYVQGTEDKTTIKYAIPDYVLKVARILQKEGYKAFLVGGALRDIVMGIEPDDYDLGTDAKPEEMLKFFPKSISTGVKFGMVMVLVPDNKNETHSVEVTTFRSEADYVDGRWPTKVEFIGDLDRDLGRRDFTINAMALDLTSGDLDAGSTEQSWVLYDPYGGMTDLGLKVLRAVGTPIDRFREDGLRAFRACRLASQLGFDIEVETYEAIKQSIPIAMQVSMERIRDEILKLLYHSAKPSRGIEMLRETGLLERIMPELLEGYGVEQKLFHHDDVYHHLLNTCDVAPDNIKLAALFHDIGKPRTDMHNGHFYGHDTEGEKITREIMKRLKFPNAEIDRVARLVRNHMFFFPYTEDGMSQEQIDVINEKAWTDSAVRRFIARVGEENVDDLFALRIADASANPKTAFQPKEVEELQKRISEVRAKDMVIKVTDLVINGEDLMSIGFVAGPQIGIVLNELLELVLDDPMLNTREKLLEIASQKIIK